MNIMLNIKNKSVIELWILNGIQSAVTTLARLGRPLSKAFLSLVITSLLLLASQTSSATQLSLAPSPLFLQTPIEPNIMPLLDDSGSMEWEFMVSITNGGDTNGLPNIGGWTGNYYVLPSASNGLDLGYLPNHPYTVPVESSVTGAWRAKNSSFNALYYDPTVVYKPWPGSDASGNPLYTNSTAGAAQVDPTNVAAGTLDLTATTATFWNYAPSKGGWYQESVFPAEYYTWTDSNSDGIVDATDTHALVQIMPSTPTYTKASTRTDCVGTNCTYAEEIQNFANWYTYYRKRSYMAKNAIGNVINLNNSSRMGLQVYNGGLIQNTASMSSATNKRTLLQSLYGLNIPCTSSSCPGTPARGALQNLGELFKGASSPILSQASGGNCQQNYDIVVTDGYWNGGDPSPSVGNADGDSSSTFDSGSSGAAARPYGDNISNTLADVAMYYYENDLKSGLTNDVPQIPGIDTAPHQHLVTYTVALGVVGTLDPFNTITSSNACDSDPTNTCFSWPDPTVTQDATRIDDTWHAAYNGRGKFFSAKNPTDLSTALQDTFYSIGERTGSASAVAVNSRSLNTNTRTYQARFTSGEWSGDLRALPIDVTTGNIGTQIWSAKDQLKTQDWNTGRQIITRNSTMGIPFRWTTSGTNSLTSDEQTALNTDPTTSTADGQGQARLHYLRGDSTNEGTGNNYRVRVSGFKLGDIVNSSPIFVGGPVYLPDSLETALHSSFRSTHVNRTQMIYVGANDGMLHGFDDATGLEKIAYVPSMVYANLNQLTNPSGYTHRYYVDGSPTVGDAYGNFSNGCSGTACWRTVLVSGLNGGGKGVFALDVTDPSGTNISTLGFSESNAANIALWEFADSTTPNDMGYTYSQPTIARMQNGQWAAIFGNGYNSVNENAILYIVNVVDGSLIRRIPLTSAASGTASNGLSTPAVLDKDGDYIADYIYAGDLQGNMWKIDVTGSTASTWGSYYQKSGNPAPLFKAKDGSNVTQPITERPEVSDHPDGQSGFMIYFGTGRYLADGDKTPVASPIQSFYGIWDSGGTITGSDTAKVDRSRLRSQTISTSTTIVAGQTVRTVTDDKLGNAGTTGNPQTWGNSGSACGTASGSCMGWVDDLLTNISSPVNSLGEMSVSNPVLLGGATPRIIFTTLIPENSACSYGGSSWLMELNPIHGGLLGQDVFGFSTVSTTITTVVGVNQNIGIMPEPVIVRDPANKRDIKIVTGTTGAIQSVMNYPKSSEGGRQSWRQLR